MGSNCISKNLFISSFLEGSYSLFDSHPAITSQPPYFSIEPLYTHMHTLVMHALIYVQLEILFVVSLGFWVWEDSTVSKLPSSLLFIYLLLLLTYCILLSRSIYRVFSFFFFCFLFLLFNVFFQSREYSSQIP